MTCPVAEIRARAANPGARLLSLVLAAVALGWSPAKAGNISTLRVRFERTVTRKASAEMAKGVIYFQSPNLVVLHVDSSAFASLPAKQDEESDLGSLLAPLNQWMRFKDSSMLIHYPDEAKAFDVRSRYPFALPFFQAFVGIVREDIGLEAAGFVLDRSEERGETLVTHWLPPKEARKELSEVRLSLVDNCLSAAEMRNGKGKTLTRTVYGDYEQFGEDWFPMSVASFQYADRETIEEQVVYSEPEFGIELPDSIVDYELPAGTDLKTVIWQ
jgi:hypothetical protein